MLFQTGAESARLQPDRPRKRVRGPRGVREHTSRRQSNAESPPLGPVSAARRVRGIPATSTGRRQQATPWQPLLPPVQVVGQLPRPQLDVDRCASLLWGRLLRRALSPRQGGPGPRESDEPRLLEAGAPRVGRKRSRPVLAGAVVRLGAVLADAYAVPNWREHVRASDHQRDGVDRLWLPLTATCPQFRGDSNFVGGFFLSTADCRHLKKVGSLAGAYTEIAGAGKISSWKQISFVSLFLFLSLFLLFPIH